MLVATFGELKDKQEIDYIEDKDGEIRSFEFKWNVNSKLKIPKAFSTAYPDSVSKLITPKNYIDFVTTE